MIPINTGSTFEVERLYGNRPYGGQSGKPPHKTLGESIFDALANNPNSYIESETWDPPGPWINEIHTCICELLELEDWSYLRVIPAIGTALDIYHGIDFFLVYEDPYTGKIVIVTVDITTQNKKDEFKADVLATHLGAIPHPELRSTNDGIEPFEVYDDEKDAELIRKEKNCIAFSKHYY